MIILTKTLKTFDNKVNKIKSLAKKKYYLQKILKKIDTEIAFNLWYLNKKMNEYREMKAKYPTARDSETLDHIRINLRIVLPEQKLFKARVLTLIAEVEPAKNETN